MKPSLKHEVETAVSRARSMLKRLEESSPRSARVDGAIIELRHEIDEAESHASIAARRFAQGWSSGLADLRRSVDCLNEFTQSA